MGPIRYLALRRMHLVRRALLRSTPAKATVTQLATDYGFWDSGASQAAIRPCLASRPPKPYGGLQKAGRYY